VATKIIRNDLISVKKYEGNKTPGIKAYAAHYTNKKERK
jgi:hypothetical protein